LNFKHTIFGEVTDQAGRDVVDAIATAKTGAQDRPAEEILITSITIK
jgi:peptidyl-prolyl cis-trans isomerase A (cyclophilin A)